MYDLKLAAIPDAEVIRKVIGGETSFFEILIRKNNSFLYKTGRSYGLNHHDTEDLMQEAFIAAYLNLSKFQQRSSFKTWVIQIMMNLCYRKTRKLSFRNEKPGSLIFKEETKPMFSSELKQDAHVTAISRELIRVTEKALIDLPLEYRVVFSLRELNGMSTTETAKVMNITETNVKVRLNRARHMLKEKVGKMYSLQDVFDFNLIYCNEVTHHVMLAICRASQQ